MRMACRWHWCGHRSPTEMRRARDLRPAGVLLARRPALRRRRPSSALCCVLALASTLANGLEDPDASGRGGGHVVRAEALEGGVGILPPDAAISCISFIIRRGSVKSPALMKRTLYDTSHSHSHTPCVNKSLQWGAHRSTPQLIRTRAQGDQNGQRGWCRWHPSPTSGKQPVVTAAHPSALLEQVGGAANGSPTNTDTYTYTRGQCKGSR